jgi:hypothetical protein
MVHHKAHVARKPGVVQRGRQALGVSAVAHVHAHHIQASVPRAGGYALDVAGVGRTLKPMDQHQCQAAGAYLLRLPMALAQYAAPIGRVHLNRLRYRREPEGRPGKIISDDRLQVAVGQAAPGLEWGEMLQPRMRVAGGLGQSCRRRAEFLICLDFRNHLNSPIRPIRLFRPPAATASWQLALVSLISFNGIRKSQTPKSAQQAQNAPPAARQHKLAQTLPQAIIGRESHTLWVCMVCIAATGSEQRRWKT